MRSNKMSPALALTELVAIREELHQETQRYAQRDGVRQAYLDRRNDLLGRLWEAVESFQSVHYLSVWSAVEDRMNSLWAIDSSLDSVTIYIDFKPNPCHTMHIPVDLSYQP